MKVGACTDHRLDMGPHHSKSRDHEIVRGHRRVSV